jgi:ABC-type sugar transport system ATPase subunit
MNLLTVSAVSKKEQENYVLKNINFIQAPGQKIAIAGETGSGKSTLLRLIAGLGQPDHGHVLFEESRVKGPLEKLLPGHPQIAYLSQSFELRNHYRVEELLQMACKVADNDAKSIYRICKIDYLLNRWSDELSGGERQRVAFAKSLVSAPKLLLLDEPFSNLDAIHRSILKTIISDIEERLKMTIILVSHDPVDSLSWAQEIIVLDHGRMIQKGTPHEIYKYPLNEYVAGLFGTYSIISPKLIELFPLLGEDRRRFIRPNDFVLSSNKNDGIAAEVEDIQFMGSYFQTTVSYDGNKLIITTNRFFEKGAVGFIDVRRDIEQSHHLE